MSDVQNNEIKNDAVVTAAEVAVPEKEYASIDDFKKIEMHVGKIVHAEPVQGSEKLLRLEVSFGVLGQRQVVSGIALHTSPEKIIGTKAVFVTNLAPRTLMGLESQAMILAGVPKKPADLAVDVDFVGFSIIGPHSDIVEGTQVG